MRLDRLTIGSDAPSSRHQFKNLKNLVVDFDENHWITVVLGWNGTGKSNVLEAIAIIFRDLMTEERKPQFAYKLDYRMGLNAEQMFIHIDADPDRNSASYIIFVADEKQARRREGETICADQLYSGRRGTELPLKQFFANSKQLLPNYVFSYYSGESPRMQDIFLPYLRSYYKKLLHSVDDPAPKRLFYALPVHSQFVLLAFLLKPDPAIRDFLLEELGIDPDHGFESALFVLKKPPWPSNSGDPRFWNARGLVQRFLSRLMDVAIAPITIRRAFDTSVWAAKRSVRDAMYLYVDGVESLRKLVGDQAPNEFFRDLESTYVSELIDEVRIRVRLRQREDSVTFRDLSEGEQQLLTVMGLLQFTADEESLFLLDEPDTHLNPHWSVKYLSYLQTFISQDSHQGRTSQILMTTHNPLAVAELLKEQVQVLQRRNQTGEICAAHPAINPRGTGFSGLLKSDLFKLPSSLDITTQLALDIETKLSHKDDLTPAEAATLADARAILKSADFRNSFEDPVFEEYIRARNELTTSRSPIGLEGQDALMDYPASPRRRRVARKLMMKMLGITLIPEPGETK